MSTKGYEEEIVALLKKLKMRKDQKTQLVGTKRSKLGSSRLDKELRRLECSIKFVQVVEELTLKRVGFGFC